MKVHFIAIGGSAMHNLAIALHQKGFRVSGSDDEIFDPARSRLAQYGLLPTTTGWDPRRITPDLDAVVLGMHARADNPELIQAQQLGLRIYSYPEYLYEQAKEKRRVVVGGSHGKTTTTAMILHVLQHCGIAADYMVGAQLEGFDVMVRLSESAKVMVLEGDEYLTSALDRRPKFHLYRPHVGIITGIEWDHVNVFPTFDSYREQFARFADLIEPHGTLIYCDDDPEVRAVAQRCRRSDITKEGYSVPPYTVKDGTTFLTLPDGSTPLRIFGRHNLLNLTAARLACNQLGVDDKQFYEAIATFGGASRRLELVGNGAGCAVYKDFAHAPSKLRATIGAVREQFPDRHLVACMELHTFSSLTAEFLQHYAGTMDLADEALVYYSPQALRHKRLPDLDAEQVTAAFAHPKGVRLFTDAAALTAALMEMPWHNANLLMMSSGNFGGIDIDRLAASITKTTMRDVHKF